MNLIVRQGEEKDWGYVLSTWLKTAPQIGDRTTRKNHMRRALERGSLKVACSDEDLNTLIGWALKEKNDLLWIYIAKDFRQLGLGKELVV